MAPQINVVRTITSGLLAGVVIIALNIAAQLVLGERVQREMNAWMPGAADRMQASGAAVVAGLAMKLAIGVILVWLYAAARPRLGPGPKTASLIALAVSLLGAIFFSDFPLTGIPYTLHFSSPETFNGGDELSRLIGTDVHVGSYLEFMNSRIDATFVWLLKAMYVNVT